MDRSSDEFLSPLAAGACLVVIFGIARGTRWPLAQRETTIGRTSGNGIRIDHDSVSRAHATVIRDDWGVRVRDNQSTNGTYVNDQRVREVLLKDGDIIKIGESVLRYKA